MDTIGGFDWPFVSLIPTGFLIYGGHWVKTERLMPLKEEFLGNSLVVQRLGLSAFTALGPGSIPGRETKILQATWCSLNK